MVDIQEIFEKFPFGVLVIDYKGEILSSNKISERILGIGKPNRKHISDVLPGSNIIKVIKEGDFGIISLKNREDLQLLEISLEPGKLGLALFFSRQDYDQKLILHSSKMIALRQELEAVMNLSGELVTITDGDGMILRVNDACQQMLGVKESDFVGKSASLMEEEGIISDSSTKYVIKKKTRVTLNQTTKSGRRLLVVGHPIFSDDGTLNRVINISKDVTEISNLKKKLDETKSMLNLYQQELNILQKKDQKIVAKSKAMEKVYEMACRVADVDATIFLQGETGVGKEVLARAIHNMSNRKEAPFIKVNCGAIPESIMESELFGYAKGTFTGGNRDGKKGLAQAAHKGTLFLDEIGELPFNLQAKLLQFLQDKQFTPLGETKQVAVDVRFIAATNRNLEEMVSEGTFREDLYYRLFVVPIKIPSLTERKEDIPFLINHFLDTYNRKYNLYRSFDNKVVEILIDHEWKGNVRELQNTIERLVLTANVQTIQLTDLPDKLLQNTPASIDTKDINMNLKQEVEQFEKRIIMKALETSSTMREASKKLGVDASTITRKVKKYDINVARLQFLL
ncbi:PAS domain S-box-containing protein [Bacillus sp. OV322]|uniref:sigma 54-interacting transcriptional regulator n=1 Tax=Bacillus sp. OV322 TaxID=1882764 RepID=UPI0008F129E9|nr:sigma 54-interacting transcriptional regulator [Bacillus sp. OV322]SFC65331.1 PAS domain S-box-containing protein [Bacillus sp. OV322]